MKKVAVIMAGGKGERLWPKSRISKPKQFLTLGGGEESMIVLTVKRMLKLTDIENIFIVTGEAYYDIVREQLPDLPAENVLCEPEPKNTTACIGFAAEVVKKRFSEDMKRDGLVAHDPINGLAYKFYYTDPIPRGEVSYHYPSTGRTLRLDYDGDKIPWLGVWINNGSFKGMYNVALEIAIAPYDSPAEAMKANACSYLPAGSEVSFSLRFRVDEE
jgi:hypothetical protein